MSAQPYTPEEIADMRNEADRVEAAGYCPCPTTSRWLATVDALTSRLDAATRRADEVGALLREAIGELHRMSHHREDCHEYDEDVGLPKRDFSDDEEWDRVEMYAAETATRLTDALKRIDAAKEGR